MDYIAFKKRYEHKEVFEQPNNVTSNPLVTVCVQTYQHSRYIKRCLDSILMQKTNFDFEIILGEDASTDGTREICKKYAENYPNKIRLFLHYRENNIAIDDSPTGRFVFITNLFSSKGKYIALCEGDDYWTDPLKLQKQVNFLETNSDFVLSFHDVNIINEKGENLKNGRLKNNRAIRSQRDLVIGAHLPTCTVLFRNMTDIPKAMLKTAKIKNGDTYLFAILGHKGKAYRHFDINNAVYRIHSGGIWSGIKSYSKFLNGYNTFKQILKVSDKKYYKQLYRKLMSINYNLIKKAPDTRSRLFHLQKLVYYSFRYLITR